jgi:hypothetical protein
MKDEVEDFLRRVAQMRAQAEAQAKGQQQRPAQQPARAPQPPRPPRQKPPARLVPARQERPQPQPLEAEVVDAELAERADRVGRQVLEDLRGAEQIAEHTRHLGEEVDLADEKLAAHLHQVFDHQIGHLKVTSGETALVKADRSSTELSLDQIMRLLSSPGSVRDAIVMSEILRRPEW